MIRAAFVVLVMAVVSAVGIPLQWISVKLGLPSRRWIPWLFHRIALATIGVRVHVRGTPARERPLLLVSNHSSWLDIPVMTSILPVIFIAKSEIARWPLFGLFAKLQRSVFVDRSRKRATGDVNREIAGYLAGGDPVVLFGEGHAGDGNRVMPFRSALLGGLRDALSGDGARGYAQPVSIAYTRVHGLPMGRQHRCRAAWYGEMSLPQHLKQVLSQGAIDVVVSFGEALPVESTTDRKVLSRTMEDTVRRMTLAALAGGETARSTGVSGAVPLAAETR